MATTSRLIILASPFLAAPVLAVLIARDVVAFGAGDKDIVLLIPYLAWALIFLLAGILSWRNTPGGKAWVLKSLGYSLAVLLAIWLALFSYSTLSTL